MTAVLRRRLPQLPPALLVLAVVVYVPLLLTEPGVVGADTKAYLYLDPGRLLSRAWSMWDPGIGLGTVTHQNLGYLWPMGPFYWFFELLGVPDWIAQRLWLGTIFVAAGAGVRYLSRTLDQSGPQVTAAMFLYALAPYVLTLAARISVILLPFAGLPWMVALTIKALRHGGWRYPALFALVVTTVGSVNATGLLLAGVGPLLWVIHAVWVVREVPLGRAAAAVGRIGLLTVAASAWWISGLAVQGGFGIEILDYTETAAVVAAASTAPEVLRGLGYWYFYGDDRIGPWIEPSVPYTQRLWLVGLTYVLPVLALLAAGLARWRHRAFLVALVVVGTLLSVGAHPWEDPSLLGEGIQSFLLSDLGLAMRSLPRAVPLVVLGLALLTANGLAALGARLRGVGRPAAFGVAALAVLALPPLWTGELVAENLQRPEDVPEYWTAAAAHLDDPGPVGPAPEAPGDSDRPVGPAPEAPGDSDRPEASTRVLAVPGIDFASYRWGNTVDPVLPGLMDRPFVARELIPYGSPASANLLNAVDRRLQEHVADPAALAPMARLMAVGDVLVRSDLQYERYRTPRPRRLWDLVTSAPGLGEPVPFGEPRPNVADPSAPLQDELALLTDPDLPVPPPVAAVPVSEPEPIVSARPGGSPVVVAGDGEGVVELAEAGLIEGDELLLYSGSFADDPAALAEVVERSDDAALVVTDTNRKAGQRWSTVRHTRGFTEEAGGGLLETDLTDNRLPVFPDAGDDAFTVARHRGGVHARATSYGNPITYTPEERPANAVDGDPRTAWRTGGFDDARGERLVLRFDEPVTTDHVTLLQAVTGLINRHITTVELRFDGSDPLEVALDDSSRAEPGQEVRFDERTFSELSIELVADTADDLTRYEGFTSVGFAEVDIASGEGAGIALDETLRVPTDLTEAVGEASADRPLTYVLARRRVEAAEATRREEERNLERIVSVPTERAFALDGEVRLSARAPDAVLDRLLGLPDAAAGGVTATSSDRLPGGRAHRASAAIDGDPETSWTTPFGTVEGQWVTYTAASPVSLGTAELTVVADGRHSVPTALRIVADGEDVGVVDVPEIAGGEEPGRTETVTVDLPDVSATTVRVVIEEIRPVTTIDWYGGEPIAQPVALAELGIDGLSLPAPTGPIDDRCRDDLLTLDGEPVAVRLEGSVVDAEAGRPLALSSCEGPVALDAGEHELASALGVDGGLDVDRLVLRSAAGGTAAPEGAGLLVDDPPEGAAPEIEVTESGQWRMAAAVTGAEPGEPFWLALGQSHNLGWSATAGGEDLGEPTLVDGYANGWLVTPAESDFTVGMTFGPQRLVLGGLGVSGVAVLACAWLARRRPPAPRHERTPAPRALSLRSGLRYHGHRPAWIHAAIAALGLGVASGVAGGLAVGVVVAAASAAALRWARLRPLLALGAPAALAVAGLYVVVWQWRFGFAPGFEWPAEFTAVHPLGLLAVALLAADVLVDRLWVGHHAPREEP